MRKEIEKMLRERAGEMRRKEREETDNIPYRGADIKQ